MLPVVTIIKNAKQLSEPDTQGENSHIQLGTLVKYFEEMSGQSHLHV